MPPKGELRQLFKQQRAERQQKKRIEHPLAKYNDQHQLICTVCRLHVKSESLWPSHITSASHKAKMTEWKALKQSMNSQKRKVPVAEEEDVEPTSKRTRSDESNAMDDNTSQLPADFFDGSSMEAEEPSTSGDTEGPVQEMSGTFPEGFFDNAEEEARVRQSIPTQQPSEAKLQMDLAILQEEIAEELENGVEEEEDDEQAEWEERRTDMLLEQAALNQRVERLKQLRENKAAPLSKPSQDSSIPLDPEDATVKARNALKSSVHALLSKPRTRKTQSVFDEDMDVEDEDEEEDESENWRAQQL